MAEPSRTTRAGWEPRTCYVCGKRITHGGENARGAEYRRGLLTDRPTARHPDCPRPSTPAPRLLEP